MFNRNLLFKLMIWSLLAAAACGVVAVLTASLHVVWRIAATAVLSSVACAYLWQAALRLEASPIALRMAQIGALVFYLFALSGTWEILSPEYAWGTALVSVGCLTVAASGLSVNRHPDYRYTGLIAALSAVVSGICWLIGIWTKSDHQNMATGLAIMTWGTAAAVCLVGVGTVPARHWRWIGVATAGIGWALSQYAIFHKSYVEVITDGLFVTGSIVVAVMHAVLCFASRSAPQPFVTRLVAVSFTILTALLCDLIVLLNLDGDSLLLRLTIAAAIVASMSTIATAIIIQNCWRLSRQPSASSSSYTGSNMVSDFKTLRIECPNCLLLSKLPVGESHCPSCGLAFRLEIYAMPIRNRSPG